MIISLLHDVRSALRALRRAPVLPSFAAAALALGIGAPTTMYSVARGALRDLPVPEGERLVHIAASRPIAGQGRLGLRPHELLALDDAAGLAGVAAFAFMQHDLAAPGERPERRHGARLTTNALRVLGVAPALGRDFNDADGLPGAEPVAIIGDALWRTRFDADAGIIGRTLRLDGVSTTIVGVMPPRFAFPNIQQVWTPLPLDASAPAGAAARSLIAFGRLAPGASMDAAAAAVSATALRLERAEPEANQGTMLVVRPFREQMLDRSLRRVVGIMVALVSCILLVAAANVANLLVARGVARGRAVAIRTALGAGRGRIIREHLLEAGAIALAGGLLGLALSRAGIALFTTAMAGELPYWADFRLDAATLVFSGVCIAAAAIAAGLLPALQASGIDVHDALQDESRGASSFRLGRAAHGLVAAQVALSCVLLIVAGLMIRGVWIMTRMDGYDAERVAVARYELRPDRYAPEQLTPFHRELVERLASVPGVRAAAGSTHLPGVWTGWQTIEVEGAEATSQAERPVTHAASVTPGFLAATGAAPLLHGRDFEWTDDEAAPPVALANAALARRLFDGADPVGRRFRVHTAQGAGPWITIVGVVPNVGIRTQADETEDAIYFPVAQRTPRSLAILLRADGDPAALLPAVRAALDAMDPDLPIIDAGRLDRVVRDARTTERVLGTLFGVFGAAGLLLALLGLHGTVAFTVSRRARELGIRTALGARPHDVFLLAMRKPAAQVLAGVAAGAALAAAIAPHLGDALFGMPAHDPGVFLLVPLSLGLAALGAALPAARRAARTDPASVLQGD